MAYIRKLPSGKFQATVRHPAGHKVTRTDSLKRAVQAWANDMETAYRVGTAPAERGRKVTVAQWCTLWQAARHVEPATAAKDASQLRTHVLPRWESWPLASIGRIDVQTWVKDMSAAGVGPTTVVGAYHRFAAMMTDAVLEGYIGISPCRSIDLPKVARPEPRWLTRHEYDRVQLALASRTLEVPRADRRIPDPATTTWRAFVGLGCFSGLRPGELAGLDVEHLDLDRNLVRVQQVMTRHGLRPYGKSASAGRVVPFPQEVAGLLWRLVGDRGSGPVFTSPDGGRVDDRNFARRVWAPALEVAGVEPCRPYVMRHTCASWLVQAGVPDRRIMQILGHSNTRLVEVYAHLAPEEHDAIRAAWGEPPEPSRRTGGARPSADSAVEL